MKMLSKSIAIVIIGICISNVQGIIHHWSICDGNGLCKNGFQASDDWILNNTIANPAMVSVEGLFVFYAHESPYESNLAEFFFQEKLGVYHLLTETYGNVTALVRLGGGDYRTPSISTGFEVDFFGGSINRHYESFGDHSGTSCETGLTIGSFSISGAERWQLFGRNGSSVCIQVEDTFSLVPGVVRDVRSLGFGIESGNFCGIMRGCSKPPSEVIKIPNNVTSGVLRRQRNI